MLKQKLVVPTNQPSILPRDRDTIYQRQEDEQRTKESRNRNENHMEGKTLKEDKVEEKLKQK